MTYNAPMDGFENHGLGIGIIINGEDISRYVITAKIDERPAMWTSHIRLKSNDRTPSILRQLHNKKVSVQYLLNTVLPWRSGEADFNWRLDADGGEELILCSEGQLNDDGPKAIPADVSIDATIKKTTTMAGRVIDSNELEGTVTMLADTEESRLAHGLHLKIEEDATVQNLTSLGFFLFITKGARSAYRLLYDAGISQDTGEWIYMSSILLPLSVEYDLKCLLYACNGFLKREERTHKLLHLFDALPFEVQREIDAEFKNELENIGREREFLDIRVFLKYTENIFTVLRYLFDPEHARRSLHLHLLEPDTTAILICISTATERVIEKYVYDIDISRNAEQEAREPGV